MATIAYNLSKPIAVIFDAVDNQGKLGELVGKPYTPSQIVDLDFLVISNYPIFRDNVRRWIFHPPIDPTYSKLVAFFKNST